MVIDFLYLGWKLIHLQNLFILFNLERQSTQLLHLLLFYLFKLL